MVSLFRIEELNAGSIIIDDIDIARVPLETLRSRLCIIPQDPVMFSITVRFNLDPFQQHSDNELWDVLESVDMKNHVLSLPQKLNEPVAEGGENFSVGQRQVQLSNDLVLISFTDIYTLCSLALYVTATAHLYCPRSAPQAESAGDG